MTPLILSFLQLSPPENTSEVSEGHFITFESKSYVCPAWPEEHNRSLIQVETRALPTAPLCFPTHVESISFVTSVHQETGLCPMSDSLIQSGEKSTSKSSDVLFNPRKEHVIHDLWFVSMPRSLMGPINGRSSRVGRALPTAPLLFYPRREHYMHDLQLVSTSGVGIQPKPEM